MGWPEVPHEADVTARAGARARCWGAQVWGLTLAARESGIPELLREQIGRAMLTLRHRSLTADRKSVV